MKRKAILTIINESMLADVDSVEYSPLPILFQSGYLTIKDYADFARAPRKTSFVEHTLFVVFYPTTECDVARDCLVSDRSSNERNNIAAGSP